MRPPLKPTPTPSMRNPYSFVTQGGVANTRPKVTGDDAGLDDLQEAFAEPLQVDVPVDEYHTMSKRQKGDVKKALPYFVGGTLSPAKRDDKHLQARTYLTLDIEQGEHHAPPPRPSDVSDLLTSLGGAGWVYSSLSHTDEAPRYRVVLPLGKPIRGDVATVQSVLQASTLAAAEKLGIAEWCQPESWVISQAMYLPAQLDGGPFYQSVHRGKPWRTVTSSGSADVDSSGGDWDAQADNQKRDLPATPGKVDLVLQALKVAGLYLRENAKHPGMHFIVCPFLDEHESENDTQTVYYEANHDGNPRAAVKCFDTAPDQDGKPHLTMQTLVRWLRENDYLSQAEQDAAGVMDDDQTFIAKTDLDRFINDVPIAREWAIEDFAPVGKVTVLAGPGGVSKSMLALHICMYAAIGKAFGPFTPAHAIKSLAVSYEDDTQEMHKRVHGLVTALAELDDGVFDTLYDVKSSLRKNLLMYAADDDATAWLLLTKSDRFGAPERSPRVEWLVGFLKRNVVKLLVLDPVVYTHQLEENNISDMATYMQTLTYIAKQAQCAILVIHHMSKAGAWQALDDVNQASLRGASSFADNARSVGVVVSMPIKDAPAYNLPPEHATISKYAVFKHVKHNYSQSLGTYIFERKGALLMPRPDLAKLDARQLEEAKIRQVTQDQEYRDLSSAEAVLKYLEGFDGEFVTSNMAITGAHIHRRRGKEVLESYAERDWIEVEAGPRGAKMVRITKAGKKWLKARESDKSF